MTPNTADSVLATLRYLVPGEERPIYIASEGGADAQLSISAEFEDREVTVESARGRDFGLDVQGFALLSQASAIEDFYQLEEHQSQYDSELVTLMLAATGASAARVFDHTLRSDSSTIRGARTTREPAGVIHNDYSDASAEKRLRDLLEHDEAEQRLTRRFAIINAWRSVAGPVWSSPLACCDASTIAANDCVASERRAKDRIGELELVTWNPAHRWFYYPQMTRDEVLLIKTFDSATDGRARRSIHSAFYNPLAPPGAPPRESIESRLLVFF